MLSKFLSLSLLLLSILVQSCDATTTIHDETFAPDRVLRITEEEFQQSCLPAKPTVLINGTSPGPELRIREGKTYWIRVYNDMAKNNLTMHWHGLSMAASPFSDGTPAAAQWPIPPFHFFDYEIHVPFGMAGTYFYHSHVGFQAVACTGPLIVEEQYGVPPYQYDEERIVFLQDVFKKDDKTIEQGLVASPLGWSGESDMILINGKGGGNANKTSCNASLTVIEVDPGRTYRLRFVGGTALTFASLAIEGHDDLEVIEADGSYTSKHSTKFLQIGSGQRFSVLLHTKARPEKSTFYMQIESRERPTITQSFAVLHYGKKPSTEFYPPAKAPLTLCNTTLGFLDYELAPLSRDPNFPTADDVTRRVTIVAHQRVAGGTTWLSNGYPWFEHTPKEPYLVSLYKSEDQYFPNMTRALENNGIDPVTKVFPAEIGEVLEIVIQNTGADAGGLDAHPWHAHGAHYYDLGSGNGTYDPIANEERLGNSTQPVKRDTTMLYRYGMKATNGTYQGWRAWRIRVDQPGVWMIHCHIIQHMLMGMQTAWVFGNETEVLATDQPDVTGYLTYGGDVYGNDTHWPEVVEYYNKQEGDQ